MVANQRKLIRLLQQQDTQFVIPVYQRNYDWTGKECRQLFYDIMNVARDEASKSHFIGSIVYIHDDVFTTADTIYLTIIDGQQRLTTVTLLWVALYKYALDKNEAKKANQIYKQYLINEFLEDDGKVKLKPTQNNSEALKALISGDLQDFKEQSQLIENYKLFKELITDDNVEDVMTGISKLIYVDIALERGKDEPQKIFESLNSTGLDLSQGDLIRNYILMELEPNTQERIYRKYWMPIEEFTFHKAKNKSLLSDYIRHYLTFRNRKIPNKGKVYEEFKLKFPNKEIDLEETLEELKRYARFFNKLIDTSKEDDRGVAKEIRNINKLEINVSYPFLLEVYNDYESNVISGKEFVDVVKIIQSFVWRRFIVGLGTNALNKIFTSLYKDVEKENYVPSIEASLAKRRTGTHRFPNNKEIRRELFTKDLYNIRPKNRTYFLQHLENHDNKEPVFIDGNKDITIEHIFPQSPSLEWKERLTEEDFKFFEDRKHTIANLTLSGNNGSLGNRSFIYKRDLAEKGYKDSRLYLNRYLSNIHNWTRTEYQHRVELLFKRFKEIWKYPTDLENVEESQTGEINIFDVDNPTGKMMEYVVYSEQKLSITKYKKLLGHVARDRFQKDRDVFFATELGARLKLGKDSSMKGAIAVGDEYYINGWLSAKDILKRIRLILNAFDLDEELFIKFRE